MLLQLFDLLSLVIYVIFLLIQLKLQIFFLFLKFHDLLLQILFSRTLLPCTRLSSISRQFFIRFCTVRLIFKFGVDETLSMFLCVVPLACKVTQVLL
jgi:hypothetical protein